MEISKKINFKNEKRDNENLQKNNENNNKRNKSLLFITNTKSNKFINKNNKRKEAISFNYIINNHKYFIYFFLYFLLFNLFNYINSQKINDSFKRRLQTENSIIITISGAGLQNIINPNYDSEEIDLPDQVVYKEETKELVENTKLNLEDNINTIKLIWSEPLYYCKEMFANLNNLIEVDFTNFIFSVVREMNYMFANCSNLKAVLFEDNTEPPYLNSLEGTFYRCESLISIDLTTFNGKRIGTMEKMFFNCNSLQSLNISSFTGKNILSMREMFNGCSKLKYVDISHIKSMLFDDVTKLFYGCYNLVYVNMFNYDDQEAGHYENIIDYVPVNVMFCFDYKTTYLGVLGRSIASQKCKRLYCLDNIYVYFKFQYKFIEEKDVCVDKCITDDIYQYYYIDRCYQACPEGRHGVIIEDDNFCVKDCPDDLPFEKDEGCYENCDLEDFFFKVCTLTTQNLEYKELIINEIRSEIIQGKADLFLLLYQNLSIKYEYERYLISTEEYQKDKEYTKKETTIDLGECGNILRDFYDLPLNKSLIIYIMDYYFDEFLIPITEYEIFHPVNKQKLSLDQCQDSIILMEKPVTIDENKLYKYNPYSEYYSNCGFLSSSDCENKKILNERAIEFNNNSLSLCENNCIYLDYNTTSKKATCKCKVKTSFSLPSELYNNKQNLLFRKNETFLFEEDINSDTSNYIINETSNYKSNEIIKEESYDTINEASNYKSNEIIKEESYDTINEASNYKSNEIIKEESYDTVNEQSNYKINESTYYMSNEIINETLNIIEYDIIAIFTSFFRNIKDNNKMYNNSLDPLIYKYLLLGKQELIINEKDAIFQIMPLNKQDESRNLSIIDLRDCEVRLKNFNNIDKNESLIIVIFELFNTGYSIPKIEYDVYNPNNYQKLKLDICNDTKIEIKISSSINENELYKYNTSSDYYNNLCFPYTTEKGTDIILNDRRNEYFDKNMSLCEDLCQYTKYEYDTKRIICKCEVKKQVSLLNEIKIDKEKLLKNFINIKNKMNLSVMKCFKLTFSKKGLLGNIGSYVQLIILASDITIAILFKLKGYAIIINKIQLVKKMLEFNINQNNEKQNNNDINEKNNNINEKNNDINEKNNENNIIKEKGKKIRKIKKKRKSKKTGSIINQKGRLSNKQFTNLIPNNPIKKNKIKINNECSSGNMTEEKLMRKMEKLEIKKEINNIEIFSPQKPEILKIENFDKKSNYKYNEYELNNLSYEEAKEIDNRSYFQYYISLLKRKQLIIFTFYTNTDYNSRLIKISLFFLSFALYMTINALFFNDDNMHKIYEDEGIFNFLYQIPKILYSTIISSVINFFVSFLSLTEKDIIKIKVKVEKNKEDLNKVILQTEKCLKIKIILFFIFNFLFILFFWYYLSSFCAVYKNTQTHLFKDVSLSFLLSLLYPFGLSLLPGMLRIPALSQSNKDGKCLYNISKIVQLV